MNKRYWTWNILSSLLIVLTASGTGYLLRHKSWVYITLAGISLYITLVSILIFSLKQLRKSPLLFAERLQGVKVPPPHTAKFLLLLIPKKVREDLLGDLEEEFREIVLPGFGPRLARRWYWWQVSYSVCAFIGNAVKGIIVFWRTSK